jgi:hypothetical protein
MSKINELTNQYVELQRKKRELEKLENDFKANSRLYVLNPDGSTIEKRFVDEYMPLFDEQVLTQGNLFASEEQAKLEAKRRVLLYKIKEFRNIRNNGWHPDFKVNSKKFYIEWDESEKDIIVICTAYNNPFNIFGYFKDIGHAEEAASIFKNEIIKLFVEGEIYEIY